MRTDCLSIVLPLPPKVLHPNGRTRNHGYRAAAVKKARYEAGLVAKYYLPKSCPWEKATIQATFYLKRRMDDDNLVGWTKPYRDGIADAGVVANDSAFTMLPVEQVTGKDVSPCVRLTIRKAERNE